MQVVSKAVREELEFITMDLSIPVIEGMADSALQEKCSIGSLKTGSWPLPPNCVGSTAGHKEVERQKYQAYLTSEVFGNQSTFSGSRHLLPIHWGRPWSVSFFSSRASISTSRLADSSHIADLLPDENRRGDALGRQSGIRSRLLRKTIFLTA